MKLLNQYLAGEIIFIHVGHGVLFWAVLVLIALNVPWWAFLLGLPIAVFSIAGWAYEGVLMWPLVRRLLRGESSYNGKEPNV